MSNKKGMIEGLPASYDVNYVIKTNKKCAFCNKEITIESIDEGEIIYSDHYDYSHSQCLKDNSIDYKHLRENDYNSPVILLSKGS